MSKLAVKLACFLLNLPLSIQERTKLVGAILKRVEAVPLREIITTKKDGTILIHGKRIDHEQAMQLRNGAKAALGNSVRKTVMEQVAYVAGTRGVSEGDTPEKLYFYRAALWWGLLEESFYQTLANLGSEND